MPDLPPTPNPGEVWENDDGERLFVTGTPNPHGHHRMSCCNMNGYTAPIDTDQWLGWAIRTNARVVLQAKGEPKQ